MAENKEYKSDVFSMLMEDKANALQVYNALNGSSYDDPELVEIVNLERGISLSIRNDAAFIVGTDINIYEHQSSYNPNMPLRSLIYLVPILQKRIVNRDLYSTRRISIPTPHFAVFYNGKTDRPDRELLKNCSILCQYTEFVELIRKNEKEEIENPIESAIEYCISHHILEDFLRKRRAEVLKAMTIDMTFERREVLIRQEEHEEGRKEGIKEGIKAGHKEGADMLSKLLQKLEPGCDEFNRALHATEEERQELYKKYSITA